MKKALIVFVLLAGCSHFNQTDKDRLIRNSIVRGPNQVLEPYVLEKIKSDIPQLKALSFNKLTNLVLSKNIRKIEDLLPHLVREYPDYMKFYTLMYNSHSLHGSTWEEPRALVFGLDAKFVLSFNGGTKHGGGNALEVMEYSEKEKKFEFREIIFKGDGFDRHELTLEQHEIAADNRNVLYTKPNPAKCLQCHGANASPIWATYFLWPGAYGSNDDLLFMSFDKNTWNGNNEAFMTVSDRPKSQGRTMDLKSGIEDKELEGLTRYLKAKPNHPRYKWLPAQFADNHFLKFASGVPFKELDLSDEAQAERDLYNLEYIWPARPNLFFQTKLMSLNQDRIISALEKARLKNIFNDRSLSHYDFNFSSKEAIPGLAKAIFEFLKPIQFLGSRPTVEKIQQRLKENLKEEIKMQIEKIYNHDHNLGAGSLVLRQMDYGDELKYRNTRYGLNGVANAEELYLELFGLNKLSEIHEIAFNMETDDHALITAVELVLEDRGIYLRDYNMNPRQLGVSFFVGGLYDVATYLGMVDYL